MEENKPLIVKVQQINKKNPVFYITIPKKALNFLKIEKGDVLLVNNDDKSLIYTKTFDDKNEVNDEKTN